MSLQQGLYIYSSVPAALRDGCQVMELHPNAYKGCVLVRMRTEKGWALALARVA